MGGSASDLKVPNASDFVESNSCILVFPSTIKCDELVLVNGTEGMHSMLQEAIIRHWPRGIDKTYDYVNRFGGFKINGHPFGRNAYNSSKDLIPLVHMLAGFIELMMRHGWMPRAAINFVYSLKSGSFLFVKESRDDLEPRISALDLTGYDRLHLVGFSESLQQTIGQVITDHWPDGIKRSKSYADPLDHKFIFKSCPWNASWDRTLLLNMIRAIYKEGLVLLISGHPQMSHQEVDTLFFARAVNPQPVQLFIFGITSIDFMYTVDAPAGCDDAVRGAIEAAWPAGIQKEEQDGNVNTIKMKGHPWNASGLDATNARKVVLVCMEKLRGLGWRVEGTIDSCYSIMDASCFLMASCPPANHRFCAIKLGASGALRLINTPPAVVSAVRQALSSALPEEFEEKVEEEVVFDLKIGYFFCQAVFCFIVAAVEETGWRLVSSADLSVKYYTSKNARCSLEYHTLIFEEI